MKKSIIIAGLMLCVIAVAAAGCTGSDPLVGSWFSDEPYSFESGHTLEDIILEFKSDGTGTEYWYYASNGDFDEMKFSIHWSKLSDGNYLVEYDGYDSDADTYLTLSDNTLEDDDGVTYHK